MNEKYETNGCFCSKNANKKSPKNVFQTTSKEGLLIAIACARVETKLPTGELYRHVQHSTNPLHMDARFVLMQ